MENNFGQFLRQKRQENNLTQKELAKNLYVTESAVSKWEKNISHPDITLLPQLSQILGVTEHELITASIDKKSREEKIQAKKWRTFSLSWNLFFYISYAIALIPCFICNLAINKTLSWFWIVLSSLLLAFSFTNLPQLLKKHKLLLIPLFNYLSLCLLLGVCCIYTKGNFFWISILSVLFGLVCIFTPIYIAKYKVFSKISKFNDFISIGVDFIILNILLLVIYSFTYSNGYVHNNWYLTIALPITLVVYIILNILLSVRFLKINKFLKTSLILTLINIFVYIPPMFINVDNTVIQSEIIDDINILKSNFAIWQEETTLDNNIHCIIFLTIMALAITFFVAGIVRYLKNKIQK